jgi:fructosamine-3-kinase
MIETLTEPLKQILGIDVLSVKPLEGGCVGEVYHVTLPDNNPLGVTSVVVKQDYSNRACLGIEGFMLQYLKENSELPVPEVLYVSNHLLVMAFLPGESYFSPRTQQHAAELLAQLHQVSAPQFGLERDTLLGGIHQPNPWTDNWLSFFREHRLWHTALHAFKEGLVTQTMLNRLERCCDRLDEWLEEPARPALLHGDAWTTNILAVGDRVTGFIDPAIYYGHPEIELAFTTLFGTFDEPFFKHYHDINPIAPGFFELRRGVYNLYPQLVHVRLFGQSYLSGVKKTLDRLGC